MPFCSSIGTIYGMGQPKFLSIKNFYTLKANDLVRIVRPKSEVWEPVARLWLTSPKRNQWKDADYFGPNDPAPEGYLNLYHGLAIQPKKGTWDKLAGFLLNIICDRDDKAYDYLIKLIWWKVQNPTIRTEIALILLGLPGIGKGTFAYIFELIFGSLYVHFTEPDQISNQYNTLLMGRVVAFYDEVVYGHDPRIKTKLRGYITEESLTMEPKFVSPFQIRNMLFNIFASNEIAAAPLDANDRRAVVLEPSRDKKINLDYFADLKDAMRSGEVAAFVHDALAADLTEFAKVRRKTITTVAKAKLALVTGNDAETFFYHLLERQRLPGFVQSVDAIKGEEKPGTKMGLWLTETVHFRRAALYEAYMEYAQREHRARKWVNSDEFWGVITRIVPADEMKGGSVHVRGKKQMWLTTFPSRIRARDLWEKHSQGPVDWQEVEEDDRPL